MCFFRKRSIVRQLLSFSSDACALETFHMPFCVTHYCYLLGKITKESQQQNESSVRVYICCSSGHMGLEYMGLNTPLQTQGGSGGSEALSLSK